MPDGILGEGGRQALAIAAAQSAPESLEELLALRGGARRAPLAVSQPGDGLRSRQIRNSQFGLSGAPSSTGKKTSSTLISGLT